MCQNKMKYKHPLKLFIYTFQFRYICFCLQRDVKTKWPNERLVKTRVVSAHIFLRLLCPAILNPRQFNLLSGKLCLKLNIHTQDRSRPLPNYYPKP